MRFFATVSVVAALAFSAFTSAMPAPEPAALAATPVQAREASVGNFEKRATPSSIPQLLAAATTQLQAPAASLTALNSKTASTIVITPILFEIDEILTTLLDEVKFLVGEPLDIILASVDGTVVLTVDEVAQLVSSLVFLVVNALFAVLGTVEFDLSILGSELPLIGIALANVLTQLGFLVDGLLFAVTPLVETLLGALQALVFTTVITVLNLV